MHMHMLHNSKLQHLAHALYHDNQCPSYLYILDQTMTSSYLQDLPFQNPHFNGMYTGSYVISLMGQPLLHVLKKREREGLVNEPTSACPQSQYRDYQ